jgi:uncharacterized protein (TIGR03083 family)
MKYVEKITVIDLFPKIHDKLIQLLKSLSAQDWEKQTIAPRWKVKDVAAHLLDGNIRALSMLRDNYWGEKTKNVNTYQDLLQFINRLNADWVSAMKRVSPSLLIEMLASTGSKYNDYLKTLNPDDKAAFSVAWAGEQESQNWFHIAREYTEKWHHQQQIRLAVHQEKEFYAREFYFPYLNTSMRALPYHYSTIGGEAGDAIKFIVTGEGGGTWNLYYDGKMWILITDNTATPVCEVQIEGEVEWRIFTKGITPKDAEQQSRIIGKQELGKKIFEMIAVIA